MGVVNVTPGLLLRRRPVPRSGRRDHARRLAAGGRGHHRHRRRIDPPGRRAGVGPGGAPARPARSRKISDLCVSVDTRRPRWITAAAAAGASMINDIQALTEPYAFDVLARTGCAVCLMHMKGKPATMQREPRYDDVVAEVKTFLRDAVRKAGSPASAPTASSSTRDSASARPPAQSRLLPPGRSSPISACPCSRACRASRPSAISPAGRWRSASPAASRWLCLRCRAAKYLRVHDVKETKDVIGVWQAFHGA